MILLMALTFPIEGEYGLRPAIQLAGQGIRVQFMTDDMAAKCELLERMVAEFEARIKPLPTFSYEAPEEALNLMKLASRHVTGVVALARAGFHLLSPAEVAARAAFEASVRAAWMLSPDDVFAQEARWATHLLGEITYLDKEIEEGTKVMGIDMTLTVKRRDGLADFCDSVSKLITERGHRPRRGLPPIPEMLKEIGERKTYAIYSLLCQTAHGSHYSTWIFRGNGVGIDKTRGDYVTEEKWNVPLSIARFVFTGPAMIAFNRFGLDTSGLNKLIGP